MLHRIFPEMAPTLVTVLELDSEIALGRTRGSCHRARWRRLWRGPERLMDEPWANGGGHGGRAQASRDPGRAMYRCAFTNAKKEVERSAVPSQTVARGSCSPRPCIPCPGRRSIGSGGGFGERRGRGAFVGNGRVSHRDGQQRPAEQRLRLCSPIANIAPHRAGRPGDWRMARANEAALGLCPDPSKTLASVSTTAPTPWRRGVSATENALLREDAERIAGRSDASCPGGLDQFDYEAELSSCSGGRARPVTAADAWVTRGVWWQDVSAGSSPSGHRSSVNGARATNVRPDRPVSSPPTSSPLRTPADRCRSRRAMQESNTDD